MAKFCIWSSEYNIGNRLIDFQHQQLFEIINTLYEGRMDPKVQRKCFLDLKLYALKHFSTEEELMLAHGFPEAELTKHKEQHHNFTAKVNDFCIAVEDGETVLMDLVMNYLKKWLSHHVLETDQEIMPFLKSS